MTTLRTADMLMSTILPVIVAFMPASAHATGLATAPTSVPFFVPGRASTDLVRGPLRTSVRSFSEPLLEKLAALETRMTAGAPHVLTAEPAVVQDAHNRLRQIASLPEDWDGSGIAAPHQAAIKDASALIVQLAHAGIRLRPRIGPDSDGSISFLFMDGENPLADMSIFGNGTYSFYAERGERTAMSDEVHIGGPVPDELVAILAN